MCLSTFECHSERGEAACGSGARLPLESPSERVTVTHCSCGAGRSAPLPATAGTSLPSSLGGSLTTASLPPGQETPSLSCAFGSIVEALTTVPGGLGLMGPIFQNGAAPTAHTASRGSLLEIQIPGPHTPLIKLKSLEGGPEMCCKPPQ